ncbi:hypothetical protein [Streptomyces sp. ST2-7A]|uniref:hypothetical protein n=1 Tax=Streptomyces sp. ST2-7A TaxID=2907214 RepID=UPI001F3D0E6F|nr:hypothetical protein [Streptomyces sp. ST2-7A]MCE7081177.1 hypothetical protein [Streptomyces sp. ST2-7A]
MAYNPPTAHRPTDPLAYFAPYPGSPEHEHAARVHRARLAELANTQPTAPPRSPLTPPDGPEHTPEYESMVEANRSAAIAHEEWKAITARRARHTPTGDDR